MADQSQDAENSEQIPGTGFEINIPGPSRHPHQVIDSSQNLLNNPPQSLLSSILSLTLSPSSKNTTTVNPPQQAPWELSHFIEVQDFADILTSVLGGVSPYSVPLGCFIDLANYVNDSRNLFQISNKLSQQKKAVKFADYHSNTFIQQYLGLQVTSGVKPTTVKDSIVALLNIMISKSTPWSKYTSQVGAKAKQILQL